jgi:hypothetical protein
MANVVRSCYLKTWAFEGSDDRASLTEIDQRENNSDLNAPETVKAFAVSRSGTFRRIRLRQTGPNHLDSSCLVFSAFRLFGVVVGLH